MSFRRNYVKISSPPPRLWGEEIYQRIRQLSFIWELSKKKKILDINVLHIERNVFVNVFDTIMDFKGKTRDTDKGRLDLAHW